MIRLAGLLGLGWICWISIALSYAQEETLPGPYRRVFVRDTDVPREGYRAMDLNAFERLIDDRRREASSLDRNAPGFEPELESFHSQVRLMGADLVSERSRLRWRREGSGSRSRLGVRKVLSPWSPAIDVATRINEGIASGPLAPPHWMMDSTGMPSVRIQSDEDWLSWTLRPQSNSTPNSLSYTMSFPRTTDSCLVLQLPKTARIVDSNIVVRIAQNWSEIAQRLGDWPVALAAKDGMVDGNATDAFWILELSGREQASFSILLGQNRGLFDSPAVDDRSAVSWSRLIARQSNAIVVGPQHIKTTCEWEWFENTTVDRTFRIRVPEGMRLHSLTLNDREVPLRFSNRVLELGIASEDSAGANPSMAAPRVKVSADFLSNTQELASGRDGVAIVPSVEALQAYIVSGATSVMSDPSIELRSISAPSSRLETIRTSESSASRLDFSWFQSPPAVAFEVAQRPVHDTAELLARLSTDSDRAVAVVKMQWSPWHNQAPGRIEIGRDWTVETAQINHQGLGLSIEETQPPSSNTLRIDRTGPVDDGPIQIELQLSQRAATAQTSDLTSERLIALPGRQCSEALVMEPAYASRLEYLGNYARDMCDEESLTAWQRDRLPRLSKFLLFRMLDGTMPRLRWKKDSGWTEGAIATRLRDQGDHVQVEHWLELKPDDQRNPTIELDLPGAWRWQWETPTGWRSIKAARRNPQGAWRLDPPLPEAMPRGIDEPSTAATMARVRLRATARCEKPGPEGFELAMPRLPVARPITHTLRVDPTLQAVPDQTRAAWSFDADGELSLHWQDPVPQQSEVKVLVRAVDPIASPRWWIRRSDVHAAIDAHGQQRAVVELSGAYLYDEPWKFDLVAPDGWTIERIIDSGAPTRDLFSFQRDGNRWRVERRPATLSPQGDSFEWSVVMSGPPLEGERKTGWAIASTPSMIFHWPRIVVEGRSEISAKQLWVPKTLRADPISEAGIAHAARRADDMPENLARWSSWRWTAEAASWLGWSSQHVEIASPVPLRSGPPRELIPGWAESDWQIAYQAKPTTTGAASGPERWMLRPQRSFAGPALWLVVATLVAPAMLGRFPALCLLLAVAATVAGHWLPEPYAIWFRSTWVGLALGSIFYLVRWTVTSSGVGPLEGHRRAEPWHPWNEPALSSESAGDSSHRATGIASLCVLIALSTGVTMSAQDAATPARSSDAIFDVLIPLDERGEQSGNVVYVPSSVASSIDSTPTSALPVERDSHLISARHTMRIDGRSLTFGSTEQSCTHSYDVWIGESGVGRPWRIPFSADRSRLIRFLVDGIEVVSSRLAKSESELVWYPDRAGRRTLQIESQIRVRPVARLPSDLRATRGWAVEAPIIPAANAVLELETDGAWSVDFASRGRVSNPSIGRFSMQLGSLDKLSGELAPEANPASLGAGSMPSDAGTIGSPETPSMSTELLIDREQVMARTILEYPRIADATAEIELESDVQWQPVGNLWGDARLIDVRPGSTLDRRRYIVRWNSETALSPGKRMVTTTWIPVGDSNLRNVLFAECRDRRVRPNTLRYARSAGSAWTLEGISTWVPSINIKERIEWSELNERPIATSLRIPINGGFGVLRQQPETKTQRARVAHQWSVGASRIAVRSKIEFAKPINQRGSMILSIPSEYTVSEIRSRSASIAHTSWVVGDQRRIQAFIDRDTGDISELVVASEQDMLDAKRANPRFPMLSVDGVAVSEQFAELFADPGWRVSIPNEWASPVEGSETANASSREGMKTARGQGLSRALASMSLPEKYEPASILIERLEGDWIGNVSAKTLSLSDDAWRWDLRMAGNTSIDARPTLAISLPAAMCRQWTSSASIKEIPSLDPNRRLLQIQPLWNGDQSRASFEIEWSADPQAVRDPRWIQEVRMESDPGLICILESAEGTEAGPGEDPAGASVSADTPAPVPKDSSREAVSFEVHSVVSRHPDAERFSMQSIWWIDPPARRTEGPQAVAIKLSEGVDVQWICAQGASTPWIEREGVVVLAVPTLEMPLRLDMWTRSSRADEIPAEIQGTRREGWILRENRAYAISGDAVANGSDVVREMCRRNLAGLAALQTLRSSRPANETEQAVLAGRGAWQRWTEFLSDDTVSMLLGMMANPDASRGEALDALEASYRDRGVPIAAERRGHVLQRADQWSEYLRGVADASAMDAPVRDGNVSPLGSWPMQQSRWVATILMGLLVVLAAWVWGAVGMGLGRTPWWPLILIGIWIWALTGTWLPALVLAFLASFLAVDSYRIVNERFRQTAIRGPR